MCEKPNSKKYSKCHIQSGVIKVAKGDGRGGARQNAGRPRKALADAIIDGTRPSRLKAVQFDGVDLVDGDTPSVPQVKSYLTDAQKDGEDFLAKKFFDDIWNWLKERKCEKLFDISFLERYSMQQARYVQLERLISKHGFLAKSSSGDARENPLEGILLNRLKIVNQMQCTIQNTVSANCAEPFTGFPNTMDTMEELLSGRR